LNVVGILTFIREHYLQVFLFNYFFRKRKCFIGDFTNEDLNSPKRQKKFLNATKRMLFKKRKQIKTLQKQKSRLIKKIRTMKQLMTHLREEKNLISQNCFSHLQVFTIELKKYIYVI